MTTTASRPRVVSIIAVLIAHFIRSNVASDADVVKIEKPAAAGAGLQKQ
jgi:hypothetical protein